MPDANVQIPSLVWHKHGVPARRPLPPLDAPALERLALRYVERFATTRGKLAAYLLRKIRERGWDGAAPDVAALADRFAARGYVDDRTYAQAKGAALSRRGYGARRVAATLRADHVGEEDATGVLASVREEALDSALALARRRRIGPYAAAPPVDARERERRVAVLVRGGHAPGLAYRIVDCAPGVLPADD